MLLKIFLSVFSALVLLLLASSFIFTFTGDTDAAVVSGAGGFVAGIAAYAVSVVDREKRFARRELERVRRHARMARSIGMKDGLPVSSSAPSSRLIPPPLRQRFRETFADSFAAGHERPVAIVAATLLVALTALSLAEWLFTGVVYPHHIIGIVGAAAFVGIANAIEKERKDSEERTLPDDGSFFHPKNLPDYTSGNRNG